MKGNAFKTISLELDKSIAVLKFNRPEQGNAYVEEMGLELLEAINEIARPAVRSVVLTGEGKDFSTGFDPIVVKEHIEEAPQLFRRAAGYLHQVIAELRRLPKPVIGAINGTAAGAGFSFAQSGELQQRRQHGEWWPSLYQRQPRTGQQLCAGWHEQQSGFG